MAQAVSDLVLAYAGFLCAWRPIVAMTGERVARRCGGAAGADMEAVLGPTLGLVFLTTPIAHAFIEALSAGPMNGFGPILCGALLVLGALGLHRGARRTVARRHGLAAWRDLRGAVGVAVPLLLALCLAIEAHLLVGFSILGTWVAVLHHRAQVARDAREEAARAQAARTYGLRARMGEEDGPFRR